MPPRDATIVVIVIVCCAAVLLLLLCAAVAAARCRRRPDANGDGRTAGEFELTGLSRGSVLQHSGDTMLTPQHEHDGEGRGGEASVLCG
eukprot:gene48703-16878_t